MAEPTPGRPGQSGSAPVGARSATAATFQVNDTSLKALHTTWQTLITDVKQFNAELAKLGGGGAKNVDLIAAKLRGLGVGRGVSGGGVMGLGGSGGRMPGMPDVPAVGHGRTGAGAGSIPGLSGQEYAPTTPLAGGSSPWKKNVIEGALGVTAATGLFYGKRMPDISDLDLFFTQQAQNTGGGYRGSEKSAARNAMFGKPGGVGFGGGITGYQNPQDALGMARNVMTATGGTIGGRGMTQLRQAGFLAAASPDMGGTAAGAAVGGLYDPTTSARMASMGMGPSVGVGGQLQTPMAIYQHIVQAVYRGQKPTAQMITAGLQPGANLYVTLTQGLGLTPDQIEQFAQYAKTQSNLGGDVNRTNRAYEDAARGKHTKDTKLAGLDQSLRSRQNQLGGAQTRKTVEAGREAEGALMAGFSRLADATDELTASFTNANKWSHGATGNTLGMAGLLGGPLQAGLNSFGGVGGLMFGYQALKNLRGAKGGGGILGRMRGGGGVAGDVGEIGAVSGGGGSELAAAAGPVGIAIAAAFVAHIGGEAMKNNAAGKKGLLPAVEDIIGQHLSSAWKAPLDPAGYVKDMYKGVKRHAGWLPFASGGVVPGHHDRDDVNIKATPGEVVVPKGIVHRHGGADTLMRRLGFRGRGAGGHYASGGEVTGKTEGLNSSFLSQLKAWASAENANFNIVSGFRSRAKQQELYDGYMAHRPGYNLAARPGTSNHEYGLAADGPPWGNRHPERFGLRYAVEGENWHVEPMNAKAMRGGAAMASGSNAQGNVATSAQSNPASPSAAANYVTAPRTATDEKSAFAAWVANSNTAYGVTTPPAAVGTPAPSSSGTDGTQPTATSGTAPSDPSGNAALGKQRAAARGWRGSEWDALYNLFQKESGWQTNASNPSSSARGIAQTMMSVHFGKDWKTSKDALDFMRDPSRQIDWGLNYIAQRYTTPSKAWAHSQKMNWYDQGSWQTDNETAVLHKDEMIVPAEHARKLRSLLSQRQQQAAMPSAAPTVVREKGAVSISISMPVQLLGKATPDDAKHLVQMVKSSMEEDETLAKMGTG